MFYCGKQESISWVNGYEYGTSETEVNACCFMKKANSKYKKCHQSDI